VKSPPKNTYLLSNLLKSLQEDSSTMRMITGCVHRHKLRNSTVEILELVEYW